MGKFLDRLNYISKKNESLVCIGLDPDPARMAVPDLFEFNRAIIDSTSDIVCAFKPNLSFYEAMGIGGLRALHRTIEHIRLTAPDVILLGDGKRGDIGSSNRMYAKAVFEVWDFDAATVNAYGGIETLEPFFEYEDRASFVWCRSSNPGAKEFQDIKLNELQGQPSLFQWMARRAFEANTRGNIGVVAGATYPEELQEVRREAKGMPILIPGVGAQHGDLERCVIAGLDEALPNIMLNSSRAILYASPDPVVYPEVARTTADGLRNQVNSILAGVGYSW